MDEFWLLSDGRRGKSTRHFLTGLLRGPGTLECAEDRPVPVSEPQKIAISTATWSHLENVG
jgi:hypothetical protein